MRAAQRAFKRAWIGQALKRSGNNQCKLAAEGCASQHGVSRDQHADVSV
jgi:hypothetical protein